MITSDMNIAKILQPISTCSKKYKLLLGLGGVVVSSLVLVAVVHSNNDSINSGAGVKPWAAQDLTILGVGEDQPNLLQSNGTSDENESGESSGPIVRIPGQGRVRGTILKSRKDRDYHTFYKIPYARPPIGNLRFEPPKSPRRWFGVRDGTKPGLECIQKEKYAPIEIAAGEEDCLYLNVYAPKLPENSEQNLLPVMVYIHGGGVYGNGTRYGAKYFMDEDVILITFEFRLGILGHFTTGTSDYPGNIGARDRIMALKWVQENIQAFGGDPKKVLIFGNSSGANCVHELVYSPMGEGLFSKAILQSGSSLPVSYVLKDAVSNIRNVTEELGCGDYWNRTRRLLRCLRRVNASEIVLNPLSPYFDGVSLEPLPEDGDTANVYMKDTPWSTIQKGGSHRVPVIFGVNSLEVVDAGLLEVLFTPNGPKIIEQRWDELVPSVVGVPDDENHTMASEFYDVYIGPEGVTRDSAMGLWNLSSDGVHHSSRVSGMLHATTTGEPVYFYYLSKEPPKSYGSKAKELYPAYGASHADELQYLFLYYGYPEITRDSPWFKFSETLVHMWASFAATGKPESPAGNWEPISLADNGMKWFQLDDEMKTIEPFTRRMEVWDEFIPRLYIGDQE